jgi:hypothetical protein
MGTEEAINLDDRVREIIRRYGMGPDHAMDTTAIIYYLDGNGRWPEPDSPHTQQMRRKVYRVVKAMIDAGEVLTVETRDGKVKGAYWPRPGIDRPAGNGGSRGDAAGDR